MTQAHTRPKRHHHEPVLGDGIYTRTFYFDTAHPGRLIDDVRHWVASFVTASRAASLVTHASEDLQNICDHLIHRRSPNIRAARDEMQPTRGVTQTVKALAMPPPGKISGRGEAFPLTICFFFGSTKHGGAWVSGIGFSMRASDSMIEAAEADRALQRAQARVMADALNRKPTAQQRFFPEASWAHIPLAQQLQGGKQALEYVMNGIVPLARAVSKRHTGMFPSPSDQQAFNTEISDQVNSMYQGIFLDITLSVAGDATHLGRLGSFATSETGGKAFGALGSGLGLVKDIIKGDVKAAVMDGTNALLQYAFAENPMAGLAGSVVGIFNEFLYLGEAGRVTAARFKLYRPYSIGVLSRFIPGIAMPTDRIGRSLAQLGLQHANKLGRGREIEFQVVLLHRAAHARGWHFAANCEWLFPQDYKRNWSEEMLLRGIMTFFGDEPYCSK